jgi:hypothetical protein
MSASDYEPGSGEGVTPEEPPPTPLEPPPTTPEPPPEAPGPADTIVWKARTWYEITFACLTPGCVNENIVRYAPMFYSNDGQLKNIRVNCAADGACKKDCKILTATELDPQPVEE